MSDIWTIKAALDWTTEYLTKKGDAQARLSSQKLLSFATGLDRLGLYANFEQPLSMDERDLLRAAVKRRATHEPLQYITGEVGFRYLDFKVQPHVLIPRPETEILVSEVLSYLPRYTKLKSQYELEQSQNTDAVEPNFLVADIGTGSGCIACSIAYEHPYTHVIAVDISDDALNLAKDNVDKHKLADRVSVLKSDLGENIKECYMGHFDCIASNPPYIPSSLINELDSEVKDFEPHLALDGGQDGLDIYRRLLLWSKKALKPGGFLCVELHEDCLATAKELAESAGYTQVTVVSDLAGKPRFISAYNSLKGVFHGSC